MIQEQQQRQDGSLSLSYLRNRSALCLIWCCRWALKTCGAYMHAMLVCASTLPETTACTTTVHMKPLNIEHIMRNLNAACSHKRKRLLASHQNILEWMQCGS